MKRIIKGITIFIIFVLSVIFIYPSNTLALSVQTSNLNINRTESLRVGDLSFSNIKFEDSFSISNNTFGLTSDIKNESKNEIKYIATAYYYDKNNNLLTEYTTTEIALAGDSTFKQTASIDILNGYNITDIYYYRLLLTINDDSYSKENNIVTNIPSQNSQYSSYDYVIDKYDINIIVNENNTFDITETITAYFNKVNHSHGIYRTIPLKNNITRLDGTTSKNRVQISNLSVDNEYTTSRENGNYKIKIGSPNRFVTGEQIYIIKYTYNLGKDPLKDADELYYNIIGTDWDTVIGNVTFNITMPKEFDSSKLGFSKGILGSIYNDNIVYSVKDNIITGSYNGILNPKEALTVRCELPEGYFVGAGLTINIKDYIMFLIPILFLIISILLWYKYGRDDQVIETVEFYPPYGLNSLDVGFLYKGEAENQDVTSLLIYLANKGYIQITDKKVADKVNLSETQKKRAEQKIIELQDKIREEKQNNPNSKKIKYYENMLNVYENIDTPINYEQYGLTSTIKSINRENKFIIKKLKNYDGDNINELWFMEGLFEFDRNEVTDKMLYNSFYMTNNRILTNMNNKQNKEKIFEKSSKSKKIFIIIMIIVAYCLITIPPISTYGESVPLLFALLFPSIGFTIMFLMLFGKTQTIYVNGRATHSSIITKLFGLICGGIFGGMPWASIVLPTLLQDSTYLIGYIIGIACVLGMVICIKYLPKRTPYGNAMLGKIRGFKNFLETVEKEKLEAMVMQNPTYFYDILPYTYVLGVSNKWIKKFETISLQAPIWYGNDSSFDINTFGTFMNSTMLSAQNSMSSSPSEGFSGSDSSSSSSGGGSSGGGSGGGGGGSW